MSHILALLLVTESSHGFSVVFRWPPSPQSIPRLARPRPSKDFETDLDNPWRAFYSSPAEVSAASGHATCPVEDEEYEWKPPYASTDRSGSFSKTAPSVTASGRNSPSKEDFHDFSHSTVSIGSGPTDDFVRWQEYKTLFGYPTNLLASLLCPKSSLCHQKFELAVDDLVFVGHPVCAENDRVWCFPHSGGESATSARRNSQHDTDLYQPQTQSSSLQTFHFVVVFDLPDPMSSASGSIAKYFHIVYEQIAFTFTAVLFQEQVLSSFVEKECDGITGLREQCITKKRPYSEYVDEALRRFSIPAAMKALFEGIKSSSVAYLTIHDIPLELQLPPFLDAILQPNDYSTDLSVASDEDAPGYWGSDMNFAWRLPVLAPWKSLLLLDDSATPQVGPDITLRGSHVDQDDRPLAESLFKFLQIAHITVSLADMAAGLEWDLESQVYPTVRWLVQHRRAKVVDVVHERLKTPFTVPAKFNAPLAELSVDFEREFGEAAPPLPVLLSTISANTQRLGLETNNFFATIVKERALLPTYLAVVRWLLRRDLLVRLHLRIRVVATPPLKARVREERERARLRRGHPGAGQTRSIRSRRSGGGGAKRAANVSGDSTGRERHRSPAAEGDGVFVAFSPRSARMHARRVSSVGSAPAVPAPLSPLEHSGGEDEESDDDWDDDTLTEACLDDEHASFIKNPSQATPLERRWLSAMSEGKDPLLVARFDLISQYFDGKSADDEILYRANISRRQLREVLHAYDEYLETFLHS